LGCSRPSVAWIPPSAGCPESRSRTRTRGSEPAASGHDPSRAHPPGRADRPDHSYSRQEGRFPQVSEQPSSPEDSYEDDDDSLSVSSSPGTTSAPQESGTADEAAGVEPDREQPADRAEGEDTSGSDDASADAAADSEAEDTAGDEPDAAEDSEAAESGESEEPEEEDQLAALRRQLRSAFGEWYVVHSYSGHENRVKTQLTTRTETQDMEDHIFQVEVPMEAAPEVERVPQKIVRRVWVPAYVPVRMDLTHESWRVVRYSPGVTGFVRNATNPTPLSFDEIYSLLAPAVGLPEKKRSGAGAAKEAA